MRNNNRRAYLDHSKDLLDEDREELLKLISLSPSMRSNLETFRVAIQNELDSNRASSQKLSHSPLIEPGSSPDCAADRKSSTPSPSAPLLPNENASVQIEGTLSAPPTDVLSSSVPNPESPVLKLQTPNAPTLLPQTEVTQSIPERKIIMPSLIKHASFLGLPQRDPLYDLLNECIHGDWKGNIELQKKMSGIALKLLEARSQMEGEKIDVQRARSLLAQ